MQLLVFVGLAIVQCLPLFWKVSLPDIFWVKQVVMFLIWVVTFYFTLKIMLPRLLFKSRAGLFFILMVALVFFTCFSEL